MQTAYESGPISVEPYDTRVRDTGSKMMFPSGEKPNTDEVAWVSDIDPELSESDAQEMFNVIFDKTDISVVAFWIQKLSDSGGVPSLHAKLAFDSRATCIAAANLLQKLGFNSRANPDCKKVDRVAMNLGTRAHACVFVFASVFRISSTHLSSFTHCTMFLCSFSQLTPFIHAFLHPGIGHRSFQSHSCFLRILHLF